MASFKKMRAAEDAAKKKAEDNRRAHVQATRDALMKPRDVEIKREPGKTLSLNEQNILTRRADRLQVDIARDAALAAATAVQKVVRTAGATQSVAVKAAQRRSKAIAKASKPSEG